LLTHELDLGVDVRPIEGFESPSGLRSELLFEGEMVHIERAPRTAAGAKHHAPAPMNLENVDTRSLIGLNRDDLMGAMVHDALERHGVLDVLPVHVHTHFVAKSMVMLGGGSAILDEFTVSAGGSEGLRVRRVLPRLAFCVQVLVPAFRAQSPNVDVFVEALREAGRQLQVGVPTEPQ
jgi:DNA-binding transcriptional LysR family regulator